MTQGGTARLEVSNDTESGRHDGPAGCYVSAFGAMLPVHPDYHLCRNCGSPVPASQEPVRCQNCGHSWDGSLPTVDLWRDGFPTQPGWYWRLSIDGSTDVIEVDEDGVGRDVYEGTTNARSAAECGERFFGPLSHPRVIRVGKPLW